MTISLISTGGFTGMCRLFAVIGAFTILVFAVEAGAEQNKPYVIPQKLQEIAIKAGIAQRLNINWDSVKTGDVFRYISMLASAAVIADELAKRKKQELPSDADYLAALMSECLWPPNKPPFFGSKWRSLLYPSFYDEARRSALRKAVGPQLVMWPQIIAPDMRTMSYEVYQAPPPIPLEKFKLPKTQDAYFENILDLRKLERSKVKSKVK